MQIMMEHSDMGQVQSIRKVINHQFFPKPEVIEMAVEIIPVRDKPLGVSNCRLRSSWNQNNYQLPQEIEYAMSDKPPYEGIARYLREMEIKGFGEGAVVARRYAANWRWKFPTQWGVIMLVRKGSVGSFPYAPYSVKWFDEKVIDEPAWAEDLIVIHACIDEVYLRDIVESQGIMMEGDHHV